MFFHHIDFIFRPFRAVYSKWLHMKNMRGNFKMDVARVKNMGKQGQMWVGDAQKKLTPAQEAANKANGGAGIAPLPGQGGQGYAGQPIPPAGQPQVNMQGASQMQGNPMQGAPGVPGMPGGAGMPGMPPGGGGAGGPPIVTRGFLFWKKRFCGQCQTKLDKTWDRCPYCAQMAALAAAPVKAPLKTQAFIMDATGKPGQAQLIGWIVPLGGPNRGELYTLSPYSTVGNDPASTIVLQDRFMSGKHAEIKAENGLWVLRDLGSTNGTYVNNRRIDKHELVDNDFIKFGGSMVKFKCL